MSHELHDFKDDGNKWINQSPVRNEPPRDKTNKVACATSEDSDQSDQSIRYPHEDSLGP